MNCLSKICALFLGCDKKWVKERSADIPVRRGLAKIGSALGGRTRGRTGMSALRHPLLITPLILFSSVFVFPRTVPAESVLNSKHDLSLTAPGPIKATTESEVCLFCHTPHRGTGETPLWNHKLSAATYAPYDSTTMKATVGQPTGSSKLCLSCHDGTIALGMVNSRTTPIAMSGGTATMPSGRSNLGTDLSDDHPISFTYDSALASANGQLKQPGTLTGKIRVDHNSEMQCTSCHDPHNNQWGKFLVENNVGSALCVTCHDIKDWQNSTHRKSNKIWNGAGINPWPHTSRHNVADNACENCHSTHGAGLGPRLLTFPKEEDNCFSCHNGNVAGKNIESEFKKASVHPILTSSGIHDAAENIVNPSRHVACADCHNPHASKNSPAVVPNASGALAGLTGINEFGSVVKPLTKEYELCFRCHGDSLSRGPARVTRQYVQTNTRLEFSDGNASFHPVETPGKNHNVPSLLAPLTVSSLTYCTDCHNNDQGPGAGGSGPNGPHGSAYSSLLERRLAQNDFNIENYANYALCYKCHDRGSILADQSFPGHNKHIVTAQTACTTCHDPHGVAAKPHLINFNTTYVTPSSGGQLYYQSRGNRSSSCALTCHGKDHNPLSY